MGQHTARRTDGTASSLAGRSILTAAAAVALLGGGSGMAFAGNATADDSGSSQSDSHDGRGHDDHGTHGHGTHGHGTHGHGTHARGSKHHEKCEIPVDADASTATDDLVNDLTDDETKPFNDAVAKAEEPIDDAVCPVIAGGLNDVDHELGEGPKDDDEMLGQSPTGF